MKVGIVLYFCNYFGGAERRLLRIYNRLADNIQIDLIVRGGNKKQFKKSAELADVNLDNFTNIIFTGGRIKTLLCIKRENYSTIQIFDKSRFNIYLLRFCKMISVKTICTFADFHDSYGLINKKAKSILERQVKLIDKIDVLYPRGKIFFEQLSGKANVYITPGTFTDLDLFYPKEKKNIMIFAAARLELEKNPWLIINACKLCCEEIRKNKYQIWIMGCGYEEERNRNYIIKNKLDDIIIMKGYQKTSDILPFARVFFAVGKMENYPSQSQAEATASGCYIISTNVADSKLMVSDKFSVLIEDKASALSHEIINYILGSEEEKKQYIKAAREFALEKFNIKRSIEYFGKMIM